VRREGGGGEVETEGSPGSVETAAVGWGRATERAKMEEWQCLSLSHTPLELFFSHLA
jgi:hypothetical protein